MDKELQASTSTKNYDSEFCGSIPIQLINLIQPHGMLILLDKSFRIIQCSENVRELIGTEPAELIDKDFATLLQKDQFELFQQKIQGRKNHNNLPHVLLLDVEVPQKRFTSVTHIQQNHYLLELEPMDEASNDITFIRAYQDIKYITTALQEADDINSMSTIAAQEIRAFSGFDRVMIYRFDKQWNGTVVAEAQDDNMEPYLHLTFPASDVPRQARELYFKNPYRLIPDVNAKSVRLYPVVNPIKGGFTDLSECSLRSIPQVHIEYLNNMGVQASMSIPVIVDGKLWGLISCHHRTAKWIPFEIRYAFEVLSQMISSQIATRQRADRFNKLKQQRSLEIKLIEQIYRSNELMEVFREESTTLLNLFDANGAALFFEEEIELMGNTPEEQQIQDLIKWLNLRNGDKIYFTHLLSQKFGKARNYIQQASGLLALQFSHSPVAYLLLFRPEIIQTVNWGGNPNEAIQFEEDRDKYHPRNSFKKWQEEVRNTAQEWEESTLDIAQNLRSVLLDKTLMGLQE